MPENPSTEEPDYYHPKGPMSGGRIFFSLIHYRQIMDFLTLFEQTLIDSKETRRLFLRLLLEGQTMSYNLAAFVQ